LQPVDLLKTRVQQYGSVSLISTIQQISREPNPIRQFWRGTLPSTLRTGIGSALYFATLNTLRQHVAASRFFGQAAKPGLEMTHSSSLPKLSNIANLTT